jgi:NAD(P)-dependent dehydrogenase (short-subunit alcohol dehydrogenase family)
MTQPTRRTAIVTGTSSGLGRGVAERLELLGWDVLGTVRGDGTGLPFETVRCDMTDDDAVGRLGRQVLERWGRLDALVNNAGVSLTGPVEELAPAELRRHLDVNLVAPLALVRACLPALRAARGVVVQVTSVAAYSGSELFSAYNASKFGLEGASEALAIEVAQQGVRVVLVEPGPFRTEIGPKGTQVAAKGSTGLYETFWRETDDWLAWHASSSPHADRCIDAIVGAASRPDAPFRIPVGEGIADELRRKGEEMVMQAAASEAFLDSL